MSSSGEQSIQRVLRVDPTFSEAAWNVADRNGTFTIPRLVPLCGAVNGKETTSTKFECPLILRLTPACHPGQYGHSIGGSESSLFLHCVLNLKATI